jgi:hypothetical protein
VLRLPLMHAAAAAAAAATAAAAAWLYKLSEVCPDALQQQQAQATQHWFDAISSYNRAE